MEQEEQEKFLLRGSNPDPLCGSLGGTMVEYIFHHTKHFQALYLLFVGCLSATSWMTHLSHHLRKVLQQDAKRSQSDAGGHQSRGAALQQPIKKHLLTLVGVAQWLPARVHASQNAATLPLPGSVLIVRHRAA